MSAFFELTMGQVEGRNVRKKIIICYLELDCDFRLNILASSLST